MSTAGYALTRLRSLRAARGWLGLARFLVTRLARSQSDVVFEGRAAEGERSTTDGDFGPGRRLVVICRENLDDPERKPVLVQLLAGESAVYRTGLERDDMALAVIDDQGSVLHHSFIQFETRYKSILGEAVHVPLITNCHTVSRARGERLYPKTLRFALSLLADHGPCQRHHHLRCRQHAFDTRHRACRLSANPGDLEPGRLLSPGLSAHKLA
ncbi:MAG: hypothetical protein ACR2RF_29575 [Geminicoccaceae bacterium]